MAIWRAPSSEVRAEVHINRALVLSALTVLSSALLGCYERRPVVVAWSEPLMGPDGTRHWAIQCTGKALNCWKQAGAQCADGYTVVARDGETLSEFETDSTSTAWAGGSVAFGRSRSTTRERRDYRGTLLIKCRPLGSRSTVAHVSTPPPEPPTHDTALADAGAAETNPYLDVAR